jgi:acyl-CoA reductase-like NAD-dependent aldehyde dehydrogenase
MGDVKTVGHWIGGEETDVAGDRCFDVLNPLDDSLYARAATGTDSDIDRAVTVAHEVFGSYAKSSPTQREGWLIKAAELLERSAAEFEDILVDEVGSPLSKAKLEVQTGVETLRAAAGIPRQIAGKTLPTDIGSRISMSVRRPLGVIAGITPFNVPLIKGIKHSAMPLATANTCVLLPSQEAPVIANRIAKLYAAAGFPNGSCQVVNGNGYEIGDALVTHPLVRMVGFTGSARIGQHVRALCGQHGKRVTLELGGKNPLIVLGDANLDAAVRAATIGSFMFQGQICMSSSRIYLDRTIANPFLEKFRAAAAGLGSGDLRDRATVIGPIINQRQRDRVRLHMEDAIDKGARLIVGGDWQGNCCQPTILADTTDDMLVCQEETFGPVTCVDLVDSVDEAVGKANHSEFGLVAAVYTADLNAAISLSDRLQVGMVHINGMTIQQEPQAPFGGVGASGYGREGTEAAIDEMTEWKWITIDRS